MWRLLRAELSGRLWSFATLSGGLLLLLVGLHQITEPGVPVLILGVALFASLPLLINFTAGVSDAQQQRLRRQALLPLPLHQVGLVRLLVPVTLQLLGGVSALLWALSERPLQRGPGDWLLAVWFTAAYLLLGQWLVTQQELQVGSQRESGALVSLILVTLATVGLLGVGLILARSVASSGLFAGFAPAWLRQLPFLLALLAPIVALCWLNLTLFQRRDPARD